ncbi:CPBP family intramembrane glutamic endopeptidase [uncultured Sunxiuqinia sp.]|uniref:CPBP family intramembrane glutamic endopeptidase n=1 Tax=uncultured Sunxiuqinia sp. TaxID=1573825 RepID=UPI00262A931B|nr:CPBP family intramembrane glutamic endopeptidase [uncultured Sunxiuqinia sp.]
MTFPILKRTIIILGILLLLLGLFMMFSHIKYGFELFVVGIITLPAGIFIPIYSDKKGEKKEIIKRVKSYPNIIQSFGITGMVILGMLLVSPLKTVLEKFTNKEISMFIGYILSFGTVFMIIHSIKKYKEKVSSFNLSIENKQIIPFIIVTSIALLVGFCGPISGLIPIPDSIQKSLLQLAGQTGVWTFVLMVIAAPILEELIFRGIILDGLLKRYTPATSIMVSSLLFGIAHFNPWQFITGLIIGAFSGWIYYKTKSLTLSIIIHAAVNLTGFTMRYFIDLDSSMSQGIIESYGGLRNLTMLIIGSAIIITTSIYYIQRQFKKREMVAAHNKL